MAKLHIRLLLFLLLSFMACSTSNSSLIIDTPDHMNKRIPAEWEPQAAVWMQWPGPWEQKMRPDFAKIISVIAKYEPVHVITGNVQLKEDAIEFLRQKSVPLENIYWHVFPTDNSWARDSGPIYVNDGTKNWVQNWKFDGWGGGFGPDVTWEKDNDIPLHIAKYLNLTVEDRTDYVLEKGNLEVNGSDIAVLNWDCQKHRNPGLEQWEHVYLLKKTLGVKKIIWAYGYDPEDGTIGHIDGTARFINERTIVLSEYGTSTENKLFYACKHASLEIRFYPGDPNWLVGNGFVLAMGDGENHAYLEKHLAEYFPERDIHVIHVPNIEAAGGGIHCVTNDQPVFNEIKK